MGDEVLYHQAAAIHWRLRQSDSKHVSQKLTPRFRHGHCDTIDASNTNKGSPQQIPHLAGSASESPFDSVSTLYARHFAGFQGAGAHINTLRFTIDHNSHLLHVYAPCAAVMVVGMRNMISGTRFLACDITFASHSIHLPADTLPNL